MLIPVVRKESVLFFFKEENVKRMWVFWVPLHPMCQKIYQEYLGPFVIPFFDDDDMMMESVSLLPNSGIRDFRRCSYILHLPTMGEWASLTTYLEGSIQGHVAAELHFIRSRKRGRFSQSKVLSSRGLESREHLKTKKTCSIVWKNMWNESKHSLKLAVLDKRESLTPDL